MLAVVGCDSSTSPDRAARGDASVQVSGDIEDAFSAGALHLSTTLTGGGSADLDVGDTVRVQIINFLPSQESIGRFELARVTDSEGFDAGDGSVGEADEDWGPFEAGAVPDQWILFAVLDDLDGYSGMLFSTGGTISIPQASGQGQVAGSVEATMQGQLTRAGSTVPILVDVEIDFESLPSSGGF
ncbi:MAG: hypothetical protein EA352_06955 [Gemmatimonadales bacterium]|nr:MAG: hypothetical protein EA352_06955 [Gemmatimonadales bacterium]